MERESNLDAITLGSHMPLLVLHRWHWRHGSSRSHLPEPKLPSTDLSEPTPAEAQTCTHFIQPVIQQLWSSESSWEAAQELRGTL